MPVEVTSVSFGSLAEKSGIIPGDVLLRIGSEVINDVLDYRFYILEKKLNLTFLRDDNEYSVEIKKSEYADIGLDFSTFLMDAQHHCTNRCIFCFVDQMPKGLRDTLYFKDDDSRMSFLFGNYITLTNLKEKDIDRLIKMRISPVNISVHTMNPALRCKMMGNRFAGEALRFIPLLTSAGINVNAQLVLCPGINDGAELEFSIQSLLALGQCLQSVAVVPVGLTKHRDALPDLRGFTAEEASAVIDIVERCGKTIIDGTVVRRCYAADEFYLLAQREFPAADYYGDFDQLENGVGLISLLHSEFLAAIEDTPSKAINRKVTIATGRAAAGELKLLAGLAEEKFPGLVVKVIAIDNDFFGHSITVAGLVTATDLINQLCNIDLGHQLIFPAVMLRHDRDLFLDNITVEEVSNRLNCPVLPVENDGQALLDAILG